MLVLSKIWLAFWKQMLLLFVVVAAFSLLFCCANMVCWLCFFVESDDAWICVSSIASSKLKYLHTQYNYNKNNLQYNIIVSECPTTSLLTLSHTHSREKSEYYYSIFKSTALSLIPMSNKLYLLQIKIKRNKKKKKKEQKRQRNRLNTKENSYKLLEKKQHNDIFNKLTHSRRIKIRTSAK